MSIDEKIVATIKPDVLTPADTEQKLETLGVAKANMPMIRAIPLGILAGLFIAMGGMMLGLVLGDAANIPFIAQRLLGGLAFCVGLILVLLAGAELFTGNNLIIAAVLSNKVSWGAYLKNLIIIWVTNLIGSLIAVMIVFLANVGGMGSTPGAVGDAFITLAAMKATIPPLTLLFKAILCNFLVCLAVWMSFAGRTFVDKFVAILFPITAFVAAGAEHSVANMFLLPMGYVLKLSNSAVGEKALEAADKIDIGGIAYNLGMVTIGNIIGGAILVGVMYWIAFHKPKTTK
jgi:formate/nitrite transporter